MAPGVRGAQDEFGQMFDVLDVSNRGYLTAEEVQNFYQSIFYKTLNESLVRSVLKTYGGGQDDSRCVNKQFEVVLSKLEEGKNLEDSLYWDFIALDRDGYRLVPVKSCLLLARTAKPELSLQVWHGFLNSRYEPDAPLSWSEFQSFLYYSHGLENMSPDSNIVLDKEFDLLSEKENSDLDKKYEEFKEFLEGDDEHASKLQQHREEYNENVKYESNRLLNRWNIGGAEAVIYDDGSEMERMAITTEIKNSVSVSDLISALDVKYSMLRQFILTDMAKSQSELENPGMAVSDEALEKYLKDIKKQEAKSRKLKVLDELLSLPGAGGGQHRFTALGVMGETADAYIAKWERAEMRFKTLRAQGKTTDEINKLYQKEIMNEMRGSTTNGEILIHLAKREEEEKEYLLKSLKAADPVKVEAERLALYAALHQQCLRIESQNEFEYAATSGCLAERKQSPDFDRYSPDQPRQEKVSNLRIEEGKKQNFGRAVPKQLKPDVSHSKNLGTVDSWLEVTRLLAQKHKAEQEVMVHFLLSNKLQADLIGIKNESQKELQALRRDLTKQHDNWREASFAKGTVTEKAQQRVRHHEILSSAVAMYLGNLQRSTGASQGNILGVILARLQILQDIEAQNVFTRMKNMDPSDIYNLRKEIYRLIRDEHLENISDLVLGAVKISAEEKELVDLILSKYDKLRAKLFEGYLKKKNVPETDKEQLMDKLRIGEEKHRLAGNHTKLAKLSKDTFQIKDSIQEVMGPDVSRFKEEADHYLDELKNSGRKRKLINEPPDLGNDPDSSKARGNLISELHLRYEDEVETILENLRSSDPSEKSFLLAAEAAWQQWEILKFHLDEEFSNAAIAMGLCERTKLGDGKIKLRQDNTRYVRLAQDRLMTSTTLNTRTLQAIPTSSTPAQSSLRRVLLCHAGDWRKLYELLVDESAEELREAAKTMTEDERTSRLAEINTKRFAMDTKSPDWQDDLVALLEEAAAIKYVSRMENLKRLSGESGGVTITNTDVNVSIMADLQEEHDKDGYRWFKMALEDPQSASKIKDLVMEESKSCTNIFNVLCKYEGQADDDELLQALEDKYDLLRDKYLAEALLRQIGQKAWSEMSERERQERLFKLKMEERRLRKEGRYDELAKLLGDAIADEERLRSLMGMSREEYDRKLAERLANRKRGGLAAIVEEDIPDGEGDALTDLTSRYEEERDALLRMLAGQDARYLSEQERQRELARLRRELRKSEREERFGAAAMVLGLAERNAEMEKRLANDKKRQEELAKQRIAALKEKSRKGKMLPMPTISEEDEAIIRDGTKTEMMDAVLSKFELLFEAERAWLVHIMSSAQNELKPDQTGIKENNPAKLAGLKTSKELSDRLHEIDVKLPSQVNVQEYKMPLMEASFVRQSLLAQELMLTTTENQLTKDNLDIKTLALLQMIQDNRSRKLTEEMPKMDEKSLIQLQETALAWAKKGISENIPATFFTVPDDGDLLEKAIDGKFDAILAALVTKALIEKKGEKKWNSMTQPERDRLIAETVQKIKKLVAEGKTDEAAALLGESADMNAILAMLGLRSDEEEKLKLQDEREERKRQRIADGMSEEEANKLLEEERVADEESLKKRRRNILDLLQYDLEAQKAALLKQMAEGDEKLDEERRRQLELARLRLQQRMMQRENDLDTIAQMMALSKLASNQLEEEKRRQLELARKRLEARRNGRNAFEDKVLPLKLPDGDDINTLIDIVIRELEAKHLQERNALMKLMLEDASPGTDSRKKISQLDDIAMKKRIRELHEMRRQWRNDDPNSLAQTSDEQMAILVEATALNLELVLKGNGSFTEENAQEELLARLQKQQMIEADHLVNDLPEKTGVVLRTIAQVQWRARAERWLDNVAESLLNKSLISAEEETVIKALEEKYDIMKDKLIAEALMKQMGEKEWGEMTEKERQRRIMELKIQERKLRQEGKMDEAAALMASLIKSEEDVARLLGEAKLSQKEELEKRLERMRQLKEERIAAGLAVDDATLDAEMQKIDEEEKKKRKNVLFLLEHNLDEEREAILAGLRKQDEAISAERKRQLEIARLRRDQKQIQREDQFHAAAIIFNQAKRREEILEENMAEARAKQLALAKERIASRKARKEEREAAMKLFDFDAVTEKLKLAESEDVDDSLSAPERLVQEMESKQVAERENFHLFLLAAEIDSEMRMHVSSMNDDQIKAEEKRLIVQRQEWREKRFIDLLQGKEENDGRRKQKKRDHLAHSIVEQNSNLKKVLILKLEAEKRAHPDQNMDFSSLKNEMSVKWLADVQTSQASAVDAVNTLIADKSDEVLGMIAYGQRKSRIESWNDNLIKVVMGILPPGQMVQRMERELSSVSTGSSEQRAVEETEKQMRSLDKELEEQREQLEKRKKIGEDIDMDSALAELNRQHDAKRKALSSDLDRQRQKVRERLAARREQREELEYEAHAAAAMVFLAERRLQDHKVQQEEDKSKQRSLMQERLDARRKRREEAKKREEEEAARQQENKRPQMPPPMGLTREKTVIDVQISNEDKAKALKEMQEISNKMQDKIAAERERQKQRVINKVRSKSSEKRDRVEKIFANFEREKTIVHEKKELEFQRQKTLLQDRMHNIRTGKTKTMKEKGDQKVRDFDKLVNADESQGLSKDEAMAMAAEKLQKKLLAEKEEILGTHEDPSTSKPLKSEDSLAPNQDDGEKDSSDHTSSPRSSRMTEEDRKKKMKERLSIRKKQKQEEERASMNPQDE